ncbi:MAG TPA: hypothetical protein VIG75_05630 [Citricoccus sp.]
MDQQHQPRDDDRAGQPGPYGPDQESAWGAPAPDRSGGPYGQPVNQSPYGPATAGGYGTPSRRPGTIPLIPLALGDILGGAFSTLRRSAAAVLGTALIVALVETALSAAAMLWFFDATVGLVEMEEAGQDPFAGDPLVSPYLSDFLGSMSVLVLAALVTMVTTVIAHGVLSVVVLRAAAGMKTSLGQAWRLTGRQVWPLAGLGGLFLLAGAATMALFAVVVVALVAGAVAGDSATTGAMVLLLVVLTIAMTVVWVWIYVKVLLAPAAVAVEQRGAFSAIGRSWSLTRGHWWRTFGIVLLVSVIVGVIASVITTPLSLVSGLSDPFMDPGSAREALEAARVWTMISLVVTALVNAVTRAFLSCVTALLYVDYRIRHESFDLDLVAAADRAGTADDERFSTVRDVRAASGTEDLVPGRRDPSTGTGPA